MNFRIKWYRTLIILDAMVAINALYTNCSPSTFAPANSRSLSSSGFGCKSGCFEKPQSPITMMTSYQIFSSMLNVTGQNGQLPTALRDEYAARTGSLPDNDNIAGVNAPLQMAATGVAGEVCNSLLGKEQALASPNRRFFGDVDFTKSLGQNSVSAYSSSTAAMAEAFWGRPITAEESRILEDFYSDFISSYGSVGSTTEQVRTTRKLYLSACSAMLSSFDSLVN